VNLRHSLRARQTRSVRTRRFLHDNGLSLTCFALFLVFLLGHSLAGHRTFNAEQETHGEPTVGYGEYLTDGHFFESVFENWESEFLQMGAFIVLTVFLVQKGSAESKRPDERNDVDEDPRSKAQRADAPWPVRRGGLWLKLYEKSLLVVFALLFLGSILGHALGGVSESNTERQAHGEPAVSFAGYVRSSQFWFESFQNWQSEFLAVGSIVLLSVFLRQRGSPESKPVAAPHAETPAS
jgi:hypothetical protein